jgi:hypothetical protein
MLAALVALVGDVPLKGKVLFHIRPHKNVYRSVVTECLAKAPDEKLLIGSWNPGR